MSRNKMNFSWALFLLLTITIFAGDQITRKMTFRYFPPLWSASFAFVFAAFGLGAALLLRRETIRPQNFREWRQHSLSATLFLVVNILGFYGNAFTLASRAGLFVSTYPLFVAFIGLFMPDALPLTKSKVLGLLLSFSGVMAVFYEKSALAAQYLLGDLLILSSAAGIAALIWHQRKLTKTLKPEKVIFWQVALTVPCFFTIAAFLAPPLRLPEVPSAWGLVLYQGLLVNFLALTFRAILMQKFDVAATAACFFITPVLALFLGHVILGEPLTERVFIGALLIGLGVFLTTAASRSPTVAGSSSPSK